MFKLNFILFCGCRHWILFFSTVESDTCYSCQLSFLSTLMCNWGRCPLGHTLFICDSLTLRFLKLHSGFEKLQYTAFDLWPYMNSETLECFDNYQPAVWEVASYCLDKTGWLLKRKLGVVKHWFIDATSLNILKILKKCYLSKVSFLPWIRKTNITVCLCGRI